MMEALDGVSIAIVLALLVALIVLVFVESWLTAPSATQVRTGIEALLPRPQSPACVFNRRGSWHSASEAKSHRLRKLKYLHSDDAVKSTEQVIERGASKSRSTGERYLVRCGDTVPVESRVWLANELRALRSSVDWPRPSVQ